MEGGRLVDYQELQNFQVAIAQAPLRFEDRELNAALCGLPASRYFLRVEVDVGTSSSGRICMILSGPLANADS